jgi:hypothetical protein
MKQYFKAVLAFCVVAIFLFLPFLTLAKIGVGVSSGKIELKEPLRAGGIYGVPSLGVFNTGTEPTDYEVGIAYHADYPQIHPPKEWFSFYPPSVFLEPGKSRSVGIKLTIPVKAVPGEYFAFLEAYPVIKSEAGVTGVGVAAASKFYFSVEPSNLWQGLLYRAASLFNRYQPWTYIVPIVIILAVLTTFFRRFFSFQISIGKKK